MPVAHSVDQHFERSEPHVRAIYERVLAAARKLGPVQEDPKKTSIHLVRRTAIAGVATRKASLVLTLKASGDVESARIVKHQRASANRWYLDVKLAQPDDVDAQLVSWLAESYEIAR
jgi:hypothetical protein